MTNISTHGIDNTSLLLSRTSSCVAQHTNDWVWRNTIKRHLKTFKTTTRFSRFSRKGLSLISRVIGHPSTESGLWWLIRRDLIECLHAAAVDTEEWSQLTLAWKRWEICEHVTGRSAPRSSLCIYYEALDLCGTIELPRVCSDSRGPSRPSGRTRGDGVGRLAVELYDAID